MGTIKDLHDLITEAIDRAHDRKAVDDMRAMLKLAAEIQSDQRSMEEEIAVLQDRSAHLESELSDAKTTPLEAPEGIPTCPNCSTRQRPVYMSPLEPPFSNLLRASHECTNCQFRLRAK